MDKELDLRHNLVVFLAEEMEISKAKIREEMDKMALTEFFNKGDGVIKVLSETQKHKQVDSKIIKLIRESIYEQFLAF